MKMWLANLDHAGDSIVEVEVEPDLSTDERDYRVLDLDVAMLKGVHLFDHREDAETALQDLIDIDERRRAALARAEAP